MPTSVTASPFKTPDNVPLIVADTVPSYAFVTTVGLVTESAFFSTTTMRSTDGAAYQTESPDWLARTTIEPTPRTFSDEPLIWPGPLATSQATGRPELAEAVNGMSGTP